MSPTLRQKINDYALRGLRDTADKDYIHARMAYQSALIPQFHWSALHSLEKYAKCILLLSRVPRPKKDIKHEVRRSLELLSGTVNVEISEQTAGFLKTLEEFNAKFRYFEVSWAIRNHELIFLDRAVWEIRRYCNSAIYDYDAAQQNLSVLPEFKDSLRLTEDKSKENTMVPNGYIEQVLEKQEHPARKGLVWSNFYYSNKKRKEVTLPSYLLAENSPFFLFPEIVDEIEKYIFLPKDIVKGYKQS